MGLGHCLLGSLIEPEDDFGQQLRKALITAYCVVSVFLAIAFGSNILLRASTLGEWIAVGGVFAVALWCVTGYLWMRKNRHVSDTHVGVHFWVTAVLLITVLIGVPDAPCQSITVVLAFSATMTQIKMLGLFLAFTVLQFLIAVWNDAIMVSTDGDYAMGLCFPGALGKGSMLNNVTGYVCGGLCMAAVLFVFHKQIQLAERRAHEQQAANEMTLDILRCQRKYDTEEISKILATRKEEGVVNRELLHLYRIMNSNLQSYRPFLPNYLFQEEGIEGVDPSAPKIDLEDSGRSGVQSDSDEISYADISSEDGRPSPSAPAAPEAERASSAGNPVEGPISRSISGQNIGRNLTPHRPTSALTPMFETGRPIPAAVSGTRCVSFALLDIQIGKRLSAFGGAGVADPREVFTGVVNMVYALAKETKASVHSMLGDTVQLTWNATGNVVMSETKSALFLSKLRSAVVLRCPEVPSQGATVAGAVCSGPAVVHPITSATHQLALIVEAPWMSALTGCFDLAKRHGVMILDERTAQGANLAVECCPVEQISYRHAAMSDQDPLVEESQNRSFVYHRPRLGPRPDWKSQVIYQLLGLKERRDDLEWMYQLNVDEATDHSARETKGEDPQCAEDWLLAAIKAAHEGEFGTAVQAARKFKEELAIGKGFGASAQENIANEVSLGVFQEALLKFCATQNDGEVIPLETLALQRPEKGE